jgi:uncharacterized membrane-anchored protein
VGLAGRRALFKKKKGKAMRRALMVLLMGPLLALAQGDKEAALKRLAWQNGPIEGPIGDKAVIKVPQGYVFLDESNTSRFLELAGNPPRDGHYLYAPKSLDWFAVFAFDATGYVKDDEKIDADQLLQTLQKADGPENQERKRLGMEALYTEGWQVPPHYDADTRRLEWGMRLRSGSGHHVVNYSSRLLGRSGVMRAILVSDPKTLEVDTQEFKVALKEFSYAPGERYAEFKPGDKVAAYGLAALIVGGAAAVATKKGFWGALAALLAASWKLLAAAGVAALAWLGSLFKRKNTDT